MLGPPDSSNYEDRGLIYRVIEYLFNRTKTLQEEKDSTFLIKCSFLEIYNERCSDLFNPESQNQILLQEDIQSGVKAVNLSEEVIGNVSEAMELMNRCLLNRKTSSTEMNAESSRSHAVFTIHIQSSQRRGSKTITKHSRFNLVDLAGSERQKHSKVSGEQLKEAGQINRSLSVLGNVIQSLVDIANGKPRHIHYRDSKLTFLLKDSLGGNSLTYLIATISPIGNMLGESLSTLKFASRVKHIKNQAKVNESDISGSSANELYLLEQNNSLLEKVASLQKRVDDGGLIDSTTASQIDTSLINTVISRNDKLESENADLAEKMNQLHAQYKEQHYSNLMVRKILKSRIQALQKQVKSSSLGDVRIVELENTIDSLIESNKNEIEAYESQLTSNPAMLALEIENDKLKQKLDDVGCINSLGREAENAKLTRIISELSSSNQVRELELKTVREQLQSLESANSELDKLKEMFDLQKKELEVSILKNNDMSRNSSELKSKLAVCERDLEEVRIQLKNSDVTNISIEDIRKEYDTHKLNIEKNMNIEMENLLEKESTMKSLLSEKSNEIEEYQSKYQELQDLFVKQTQQVEATHEKTISELEETITILYEEIKSLENDNEVLVDLKEELDREITSLKAKKRRKSSILRSQNLKVELEQYQDDLIELLGEIEELSGDKAKANEYKKHIDDYENSMIVLVDEIELLNDEKLKLSEDLEIVKVDNDKLENRVSELHMNTMALENKLERATVNLEMAEEDNELVQEQLCFTNDELNNTKVVLETLQSSSLNQINEMKTQIAGLEDRLAVLKLEKKDYMDQVNTLEYKYQEEHEKFSEIANKLDVLSTLSESMQAWCKSEPNDHELFYIHSRIIQELKESKILSNMRELMEWSIVETDERDTHMSMLHRFAEILEPFFPKVAEFMSN